MIIMGVNEKLLELENEIVGDSIDPDYVGERIDKIFKKTNYQYKWIMDNTYFDILDEQKYVFYISWIEKEILKNYIIIVKF